MNPESRGEEDVNFTSLNFLEVPGGNFRPFRQFLLRQAFMQTFAAHVRPELFDPRPFFLSERHGILNPILPFHLNDTLYREIFVRIPAFYAAIRPIRPLCPIQPSAFFPITPLDIRYPT